jgi:hypothetical protein
MSDKTKKQQKEAISNEKPSTESTEITNKIVLQSAKDHWSESLKKTTEDPC